MKMQKCMWRWAVIFAALAFTLEIHSNAKAQDAPAAPDAANSQPDQPGTDQDPSGCVARLNFTEGSVTLQPAGENDWVDAEVNRPLVSGDNLWADADSRAEVHIGSTAIRLGSMTGISFLEVSDHIAQIRLVQGSLIVRVRHVDNEDGYEIDTPNVAFVVLQPGDYRLDVDPDGSRTDVAVWRGRGQVTGGGSSYTVVADQHATFTGSDQQNYDVAELGDNDGFDNWAMERDRNEDDADAANYASPEMTGDEDLAQYGTWSNVAGYGEVWEPTVVVAGWAPYRFGHWAWIGPWGWTWVEAEPWGFAPFHYGRWAYVGTNWVWVPGPAAVRPVYAPALVTWVGGRGPGSSFSFGAGVGWAPLAPGEVFVPGYRTSRAYMNTVNLSNTRVEVTKVTNVYNTVVIGHAAMPNDFVYANRNVNGGVTVVPRSTFVNAQPVAKNVVAVPEKELAAASISRGAGAEPERASVMGSAAPASVKPPAAMASRQVVALRTPAPVAHSFDQHQASAAAQPLQLQLVRQQPPGNPVAIAHPAPRNAQPSEDVHSLEPSNSADSEPKQPRYWEAQGDPQPQSTAETEGKSQQPSTRSAEDGRPVARSHPAVKSASPVEEKDQAQEQKSTSTPKPRPAPQPRPAAASTAKPAATSAPASSPKK
jgi:hypothetical protein